MILFARSSRHGENNTSKGSLLLCKSGMSLIAQSSSNVVSAVDLSLGRRVFRAIALCLIAAAHVRNWHLKVGRSPRAGPDLGVDWKEAGVADAVRFPSAPSSPLD